MTEAIFIFTYIYIDHPNKYRLTKELTSVVTDI